MELTEKYNLALDEYLRRLEHGNLSPRTLANYTHVLEKFGGFLSGYQSADPYGAVISWRDTMLDNGTKPTTVRQYLATVKIFFEYSSRRSFPEELRFAENPVERGVAPKTPTQPIDAPLTDEQVCRLWVNTPATPNQKKTWPRNYAIVTLIAGTGLRNEEVLDLTPADVDFEHAEITVRHGKGNKFRVVDAPNIVLTALKLYLRSGIRPKTAGDTEPLFGTTAGHAFSASAPGNHLPWHSGTTNWLSQLIERHVYNQTGVSGVRSHDLRHVFARVFLNVSGNISELQSALGHATPVITQIYSGRLLQRRHRESAAKVYAEMDVWAARNAALLDRNPAAL